jgi:hypothetical protein
MIDGEKISYISPCNILFCINQLLQVAMLARDMDVSPQGFYHVKTCVC